MLLRVLALAVFGHLQIGVNSNAPPNVTEGYVYLPDVGHYKVHNQAKTWDEAQSICETEGGYLAVMNSEQESEAIAKLVDSSNPHIGSHDSNYLLIGSNAKRVRGGEQSIYKSDVILSSESDDQLPDGTNNTGADKICGSISKDRELSVANCEDPYAFVCELHRYDEPVKVKIIANTTYFNGTKMSIRCNADGYPTPVIQWFKNDVRILTSNRIKISGNELVISDAEFSDTGKYRCSAKNNYTIGADTMDIKVIAQVKVKLSALGVDVWHSGTNLTIVCKAEGHPLPATFKWYKDDAMIKEGFAIAPPVDKLIIENLQISNEGKYRCEASNGYTSATDTVDIEIYAQLDGKVVTSKGPFPMGSAFLVNCHINGYPAATFEFYKNGSPIQTSNKIQSYENKLLISEVEMSDAGTYGCLAENKDETMFAYVVIDPHENPRNLWLAANGYKRTAGIGWHKVHTESAEWSDAKSICRREGGDLAVINSKQESLVLRNFVKSFRVESWIGFYYARAQLQYVTVDDKTLAEVGFARTEMNTRHENTIPACVLINGSDSRITTEFCSAKKSFVCEQPEYELDTYTYGVHYKSTRVSLEGRSFYLFCDENGVPISNTRWFKDDVPIVFDERIVLYSIAIRNNNARQSDSGVYRCETDRLTRTIDLTIHARK